MAEGETEAGIGGSARSLLNDTRAWLRAEVEYYRALVRHRLNAAKAGIAMGVVAVVLALAGLIALLVGGILTLATLIGPGWATVVVIGITFATAGLLGWLAMRSIRTAMGRDEEEAQQ